MITELKANQIFVFGSNIQGRHGAGAAKQAREQFGAEYGIGEGMTGQCYAFPTLNGDLSKRTFAAMLVSLVALYRCCEFHPELEFLITKVGCGLAGFPEWKMKELFTKAIAVPPNAILPENWK